MPTGTVVGQCAIGTMSAPRSTSGIGRNIGDRSVKGARRAQPSALAEQRLALVDEPATMMTLVGLGEATAHA